MKDIYSKIYSIAEENIAGFGEIEITNEAFSTWGKIEYDIIDMNYLYDMDNKSFLEAAYLTFLDRAVDSEARKAWQLQFDDDKEKFQKRVINTIMKSIEFKLNNVDIINNKYNIKKNKLLSFIEKTKIFKILIVKLYSIYRVTLRPIKIMLKKCLKGGNR